MRRTLAAENVEKTISAAAAMCDASLDSVANLLR